MTKKVSQYATRLFLESNTKKSYENEKILPISSIYLIRDV